MGDFFICLSQRTQSASHPLGLYLSVRGFGRGYGQCVGFPNKMGQNGGGAFLLIYLLFVVLFGCIALPAEFAVGRWAGHRHPGLLCPRLALPQSQGGEGRGRPWVAAAGRVYVHCHRLCGNRQLRAQGAGGFGHRHANDGGYLQLVSGFLYKGFFCGTVPYHRGGGHAADPAAGCQQH